VSASARAVFSPQQRAWAQRQEARSRSRLHRPLLQLYRLRAARRLCLALCERLEGGRIFSVTWRGILERYHGVRVGRYSYGSCLVPDVLPRGTIVGSYCSFSAGLRVHRRHHPADTLTQHPFFYNSALGLLERDAIMSITDNPVVIGSDVWIGDRVIILPGCRTIGDGAVIGAGSVVTHDVPPFTIVAGAPARPVKRRYPDDVIAELSQSRWWDLSLPELLAADDLLMSRITPERVRAFVARTVTPSLAL
jgi:acetyltransferase-like isoleucine patch superfamily enzyme